MQVIIREGTFNKIGDGLMFHVAKREGGGVLSGILISDERDPGKSLIFTADKGFVSREDGEALPVAAQWRNPAANSRRGQCHRHPLRHRYLFDLSTFASKIEMGDVRPKERTTPQLLNPDPDDRYFRERPGLYRSQIHERFSEMLWPFAYVIVILAFAGQARSNRQSHGSAIGAGMLVVTHCAVRRFRPLPPPRAIPMRWHWSMRFRLPESSAADGS